MRLTAKKTDRRIALAYSWLEVQTNPKTLIPEYLYFPETDRHASEINYVRILATAWQQSETAAYLKQGNAANSAILDHLQQFLVSENDAAYYAIKGRAKTAYNAFAVLLLLTLNRTMEQEVLLVKLSNGLLSLVQSDGRVSSDFLHAVSGGEHFYSFEAALALLKYFAESNNPSFWQAILKIFRHYRQTWPENMNTPIIPWLTHSFYEYSLIKYDENLAEFIFELNDWFISEKKPALKKEPRSSLASFAESMLTASRLAALYKQDERRQKYLRYGHRALRQVLKLQCLRQKAMLFPRPEFALGGFCHKPDDNQQRCDYTQHALSALHLYADIIKEKQ